MRIERHRLSRTIIGLKGRKLLLISDEMLEVMPNHILKAYQFDGLFLKIRKGGRYVFKICWQIRTNYCDLLGH